MTSRLTVNCLPQYVASWNKLIDFLRLLDPVSVVAGIDDMSAANRIDELAANLPNAEIIGRFIFPSDGGMHMKPQAAGDTRQWIVSPGAALDAWGRLGTNTDGTHRRKLYLVNEPQANGADQDTIGRLVQWTIETIGLATSRGISLCILNFGVGHPALLPNGDYDARFDDVLTILSKQRDMHSLGTHVYQPADTFSRLDGIVSRCKALGIKPPRVHITETGFDAGFAGDKLNGYRSRGYSGSQYAAFQIDKLRNVFSPYIRTDMLQSLATFCWGGEGSWHAFNVEQDTDWQATILTASQEGKLNIEAQAVTPVKPVVPTPGNLGAATRITVLGTSDWNLRDLPQLDGKQVGTIKPGEQLDIFMSTITPNGGHSWYFIQRVASPSTEAAQGYIAYVLPVTAPLPDPVPPVTTPDPAPAPETLYTYTVSFSVRSPLIPAANLTAIENGLRAIASGIVWLGAGLGSEAEFDVHVNKAA